MKYGNFDDKRREYVFDRVDVPASWTNYLGVEKLCAVVNQTAGGYMFYKSPEYHRVTRFRANSVPADRPGHYIYIRDDDTGEFWSISWQPCGGDLGSYRCRHGLSYSVYECSRNGIDSAQVLFIPRGDDVELWDVNVSNTSDRVRKLSIFCYAEFSFHHIEADNQNFQMSLYSSGSEHTNGIILYNLFYENAFQYMTSSFEADGYDALRDQFIGPYRSESNPLAVERGGCSGSTGKGGNHCAALHKKVTLQPGEAQRMIYMLGEGGKTEGSMIREKYRNFANVDSAFCDLRDYWDVKLSKLQIETPSAAMNSMINIWTYYQSEINVLFSRFASFIEVGGRTGLGYRDTAQDAMTIPHAEPEHCYTRIMQLMQGLTKDGYGLHLFQPEWFEEEKQPAVKSPMVVPTPESVSIVHGIKDACADDALWLIASVAEYMRETGDMDIADTLVGYADGGDGTVYEHLKKILDFSGREVGANGICKGLRADWNDCLNLGGGESAMVQFLYYWALCHFIDIASALGRKDDAEDYKKAARRCKNTAEKVLWDGEWYIRGITEDGHKIGTSSDIEGKVHLESNAWAVLSGCATGERAKKTLDSIDNNLYTKYGLLLNAPSYQVPNDDIGFITRVYPGIKENGSIFSHPNPWAWAAECISGNGERAMRYYEALCPYLQNDKIEVRICEPYSYCQFIMGPDHASYGKANHPFMTGSGGWSYFSATRYILGIRPEFEGLRIDPCIPKSWSRFSVRREWRGALYNIDVRNESGAQKGIKEITVNDQKCKGNLIPILREGSINNIEVVM
jgi:Cellobiose phosphorylase